MKSPGLAILPIAGLLLLFLAIAWTASQADSATLDRAGILALRAMAGRIGPEWVEETARNVTSLGSVIVVWLLAGAYIGYLFLSGERRSAILMLVSVIGGMVLNDLLKAFFDRPRPDLALPSVQVVTSSFPSGHAALSAAAYLSMGSLLARRAPTAALRTYIVGTAILLVFLIGMSRIYLGVHYPTDVLAGWCIGSAWALTCLLAAKEIDRRRAYGDGRQQR